MDYEVLLYTILKTTNHTVESIAEILDLDPSDLLNSQSSNAHRNHQLKLLSEFLADYGLCC